MKSSNLRARGAVVALGGIIWGTAFLLAPSRPGHNSQVEIWAGGVFQLGVLVLLATIWSTAAAGSGRAARWVVAGEVILMLLAVAWTVPYLFDANRPGTGVLAVLDACWPLSMAGLIAVGVLVARAGRWPAPLRHLPLAASLLIPVDLAISWAPTGVRTTVTGLYLAVAYGLLGLAMIRAAAVLSTTDRSVFAVPNQGETS
ncbi:hypothetical protein [Dactylosporangium sp. NPDC051541]|uniref:hypothetical protein n=1 Tax=Dactylosporangium sp. NPDC051541 TaxID=3363977 RepID=UPI0037A240A4